MQLDLLKRPDGRTAILMPSGFVLDLLTPDATGMPIADIAQCLSSQPRWGGAARPWYSVAEHSVMVSRLVPPPLAYSALMHDCEEFLGDWPSPVKVMLDRDYVKQRLHPVKDALRHWFGFDDEAPAIKQADLVCMATELRDLLPPAWLDWGHLPPAHPDRIVPVGPDRAYTLFLDRYEELKHLAQPQKAKSQKAKPTRNKRRTPQP
ncbi:hydrolase (plasmid) [Azospirillum sp. TSH58]|uniref:hydrolase n=1 Tax=Azospirillum sp. TSH58 TaxID=664962 RepID=UPI000D60055B|nr:hydrolase [Azospirillum sp. TSH58]AWJ86613.1 hydrolase [Azospirillum sp. TSH58]PWC61221.1 hydrolase [Azospirillum sp. TSH58]